MMTSEEADLGETSKAKTLASKLTYSKRQRVQVAALCWRRTAKGRLRVLLITSRETRRWVIPKGWPMRNRTNAEAAEREAFEEAGVKGAAREHCIGLFTYEKVLGRGQSVPVVVQVYPLEAKSLLKNYPEIGQRKSAWFSRKKAARKVREPDLKALILAFDPEKT
jgi:8-oxo-dGTP pyrophosphatase MutT (NUDIX family)